MQTMSQHQYSPLPTTPVTTKISAILGHGRDVLMLPDRSRGTQPGEHSVPVYIPEVVSKEMWAMLATGEHCPRY